MSVTKNRTFIHLAIGNATGDYSAKVPNLNDTDDCPMELFQMSQHRIVLLILFIELRKLRVSDARYVFHSLRKTAATMLEQAGVFESMTSDILGTEKTATLRYGLYSAGTSIDQMKFALEAIDYE